MKLPRNLAIAVLLALGLTTAGIAMAQSMKPENAIKARQAIQRVIFVNFQPLGGMAKGSIPFDKEVALANATRIKLLSEMPIPSFYGDGTESAEGLKTRALAEIWFDKAGFSAKVDVLRAEASKLVEVISNGDENAFRAQVGATAKACDGCHDKYRS